MFLLLWVLDSNRKFLLRLFGSNMVEIKNVCIWGFVLFLFYSCLKHLLNTFELNVFKCSLKFSEFQILHLSNSIIMSTSWIDF